MSEELITPDNLTKEYLKSIFDAALMDTSYDDSGNLRVKDGVICLVIPEKDRIKLLAIFGFKPGTSELLRLQTVNRINNNYIIVKAYTGNDNNALVFDCDIQIAGGITQKALVLAVKRFCSIPLAAVAGCAKDVVA
jgi:hypothetical protein